MHNLLSLEDYLFDTNCLIHNLIKFRKLCVQRKLLPIHNLIKFRRLRIRYKLSIRDDLHNLIKLKRLCIRHKLPDT